MTLPKAAPGSCRNNMSPLQPLGFYEFAQRNPDKVALVLDDAEVRYADLAGQVHQVSRALRTLGFARGDVLAAVLRNGRDLFALQLAAEQIGLYFTPVDWHLMAGEIAYILRDSGAAAVVTAPGLEDTVIAAGRMAGLTGARVCTLEAAMTGARSLSELIGRQPATPPDERSSGILQLYSSGTTGKPKGIRRPLPAASPDATAVALSLTRMERFGIKASEGAHLVVAPLYHSAPNMNALSALHLGQTVVCASRFDPRRTLALIERFAITTTFMVPLMFYRLLALDRQVRALTDLSSLQVVMHSGAPCPVEVKRAMIEWLGPVIYEYYGSSETGIAALITSAEWLARPGSTGRACAGIEIRILDDDGTDLPAGEPGLIFVRGGYPFRYLGAAAENAGQWRGDFFTAGDIGTLDQDGYLYVHDRRTDLIVSGGVNIYPAEVEAALVSAPEVADAAVVGVPDAEWGQRVLAVVQAAPGVHTDEAAARRILEHCRSRLARFKMPGEIRFWERLPRTETGKINRSKIRDDVLAGHAT